MLSDIEVTGKKDTRSGFGDGLLEAATANENIVALTADLAVSLKLGPFIKAFPDRFIQCGIAEANMIGNSFCSCFSLVVIAWYNNRHTG